MKKFKDDNYYVSFRNKTYHMPRKIVNDIMRGSNVEQEKRREVSDEHSCIYTNYKNKDEEPK
jgi:hypothetical protein